MKKLTILSMALLIALLQSSVALASNPDTGPGCGLGKLIWSEAKSQKGILQQLFMSTTNDLTWLIVVHWFAISTGTSGCTNDGIVLRDHKETFFASVNFESLAQDMARGQGEHLASLAALLEVPEAHQAEFFALTQEQYAKLVEAGETSSTAMLTVLHDMMDHHPLLAKASR
ncbi:MAG TPA: DUF3015 family protein [Nitrospiraceae bacterium]|jgi:hypothetical protein|nr:DUF3015 family protein [Nitrospiraceae bacterium]